MCIRDRCEIGLVGLIIFCYIGFFPILRLFNNRVVLTRVELAAIVSLALFFILSLFYGETYSRPRYFSNIGLVAVISLAILSRQANKETLITETASTWTKVGLLIASLGSMCYFLS